MSRTNFGITGVGGFVAPRHLKAVYDTGNRVVAALDVNDSVGILDRYSLDIRFFTEFERFDRHLDKLRRSRHPDMIQYLSVCAPNHLHDAHVRLALRLGANAICEKPLVLNPWNLDALAELEAESGRRVFTILQLRLHPSLIEVKQRLTTRPAGRYRVRLEYVTARGRWYLQSWKGAPDKSGGLATNIGIHFFDLLLWLFGPATSEKVSLDEPQRMAGTLELRDADVEWSLSIDAADLPESARAAGKTTFRSLTMDGQEIEFSEGFSDLHTESYRRILEGHGFGIEDARPSIELVHRVRNLRRNG